MNPLHICIICPHIPPTRCGVGDHTALLASDLQKKGCRVTILTGRAQASRVENDGVKVANSLSGWGLLGAIALIGLVHREKPNVVLIQWVPFLYHRFGVNLAIPLAALFMRLTGKKIALYVHEPWVPLNTLQWIITGPIQRVSLFVLIVASYRVMTSISSWEHMLSALFFWKRWEFKQIPVGSTIPRIDMDETTRGEFRTQNNISQSDLLIGVFSAFGSGKDMRLSLEVLDEVKKTIPKFSFVAIGNERSQSHINLEKEFPELTIHFTGPLSPKEVSYWLQSLDIYLAVFTDGVTERRTTVMAALAHGLPIVTTSGPLSNDNDFPSSPLIIKRLHARDLARVTIDLASKSEKRKTLGQEGERYFANQYLGSKTAEKILTFLED